MKESICVQVVCPRLNLEDKVENHMIITVIIVIMMPLFGTFSFLLEVK